MKVFIKKHSSYAGKWIYDGYYNAWKSIGYDVYFYDYLEELINEKNYLLMTLDSCITKKNINIINNANKVFLFVQPTYFENPWGLHPNFVSLIDKSLINDIKSNKNIYKWTFLDQCKYYDEWGDVNTLPLAFDSISYSELQDRSNYCFDVCFIGGRANNAYDEKYKIMLEVFEEFKKSNLKCGFFIDKNITHEQEKNIIYNSKISINIHDAYQRKLGLDTNERTFKSLGINGILVSDNIKQLSRLFPDLELANSNRQYIELCNKYLSLDKNSLEKLKNNNKNYVLNNHTYINRVKELIYKTNV
jgi:spore maturation protein CgeB